MRESKLEKDAVKFAIANGWLSRKFKSPARRAAPDRLFMRDGYVMFIEFKAPGKEPTEQQLLEHERYRAKGIDVHVVDDINMARLLLL